MGNAGTGTSECRTTSSRNIDLYMYYANLPQQSVTSFMVTGQIDLEAKSPQAHVNMLSNIEYLKEESGASGSWRMVGPKKFRNRKMKISDYAEEWYSDRKAFEAVRH